MTLRNIKRKLRHHLAGVIDPLNWRLIDRPRPSFIHKYSVQRQVYFQALRLSGRSRGELWHWETKLGHRSIAAAAGVATPMILAGPASIDEIDFASLPETFVLKPVIGGSGNGVFVLRKNGEKFQNLLRGGQISASEIRDEIIELNEAGLISAQAIIAEEALLENSGIVFDWKVYSFQGETPLILQIKREAGTVKHNYYDGKWNTLGKVRWTSKTTNELPKPADPMGILRAAREVSKLLPIPFARIDLYETDDKIHLGEITAMPGSTQRFTRSLDLAMGQAWERAEARLVLHNAENENPYSPTTFQV